MSGASFGRSWGCLGRLGASWAGPGTFALRLEGVLGTSWRRLGGFMRRLEAKVGRLGRFLAHLGGILGPFWHPGAFLEGVMEDFLRLRSQQGVRKAPEKHQEGVLRRFWRPRRRFGRPKVPGTDYDLVVKWGQRNGVAV